MGISRENNKFFSLVRKIPHEEGFFLLVVRPERIELSTYRWQRYVIPLNHGRVSIQPVHLILFRATGQSKPEAFSWLLRHLG